MAKATQELKYKRLKVGHACYVCRSKKIKCDGLRPCMQCKARGRNCQSSTDAPSDASNDKRRSENSSQAEESNNHIDADDESILFSNAKHPASMRRRLKEIDTWTHNAGQFCSENYRKSQKLGEYPVFGRFVRWRHEPPLPSTYSVPIEMPPIEMQMHLIHQFFETRYMISPIIPKGLFYEQLRVKGPLITPLLLNAIYCIASSSCTMKNVPKPIVFFNRAKMLLDDFLDAPRVSTVAALCLLSSFETDPASEQHCRSWIYNGMACRMCLELGLNMDNAQCRQDMSQEGIELRRRVFWSCYCLDKLQAVERERLWALPASLATTGLPQSLPGDNEADKWALFIFQQKAKLALIGEEGLQIRASYAIREDIGDEKFYTQLISYYNKLVQWRENLPSPELWNFKHCETIEDVFNETKKPPHVGYLLVIYYFMLCDTLSCLPYNPDTALQHRVCAALLIQHVEYLCDDAHTVLRYEFLGHIVIAAIRVHTMYLRDPDPVIARQSWDLFNQCVRVLERLGILAMIPECASVLQHIATVSQQGGSENQQQHQPTSTPPQTQNVDDAFPPPSFNLQGATIDSLQQQSTNLLRTQQVYVSDPYRVGSYADQSLPQSQSSLIGSNLQRTIVAFGESFGMTLPDKQGSWDYDKQNAQQPQQEQQQQRTPAEESITHQAHPSNGDSSGWDSPRIQNFATPDAALHHQQQLEQASQSRSSSHFSKLQQSPARQLQQLQSEQLPHSQHQQSPSTQQLHGHIPLNYTAGSTNPIMPPGSYHASVANVMDSNGMPNYLPHNSSSHNVQQNISNNTSPTHTVGLESNINNETVNNNNMSNTSLCYTNLPNHVDNVHQHTFYPN